MKRLIMIAVMAIGVFSFSEASAQKVIKDASGKVYIDVQDMPSKAWSGSSLNSVHNEKDPNNSLFKRFEVDKSDLATAKWDVATARCIAKGTGWRLPTQRELQLMWIVKGFLETAGVDAFTTTDYWSSTEYGVNNTSVWNIGFADGVTYTNGRTIINNVRCVREVN